MRKIKNKKAFFGALNLLVVGSELNSHPLLQTESINVPSEANPIAEIKNLNLASLKAIESSWLKIPPNCKARGFNASPSSLANQEISTKIQSIYSSFKS